MSAMQDGNPDALRRASFAELDLADSFFDSLRRDYGPAFDEWFRRKAAADEPVWVMFSENGLSLEAMLYLKREDDDDAGVRPRLTKPRMKIGTFKVTSTHHTSIGKRMLALALREFARSGTAYIYVTMYDRGNTETLRRLLSQYGFRRIGDKKGYSGIESVWAKLRPTGPIDDPHAMFPFVTTAKGNSHILAIWPKYHTRLFGDVKLQSERGVPVIDEVCANTIEKIYLSGAPGAADLNPGDHVVIYRTSDKLGPAQYRSTVTSVCTVTGVRNISDFADKQDFMAFIKGRSVFTDAELDEFWDKKRYPWVVSMLFNFPLDTYPTRKMLLDQGLLDPNERISCLPITQEAFKRIVRLGGTYESYVVD